LSGDTEEISRVELLALRPPRGELVALETDLDLPRAVLERREDELAEVPRLEHAPGDGDALAGERSGLLGRARAREEVLDRPRDDPARRIGILARGAQRLDLRHAVGLRQLGHERGSVPEREGARKRGQPDLATLE